jgi:hypothetical protein
MLAQNSKISPAIKAWIEQDMKTQRKIGEQACFAYVENPSVLNGTCAGLPKAFDCIKACDQVPRHIVDKVVNRFEEASQSLDGLYSATFWFTYNHTKPVDPLVVKPESADLLAQEKPGLMLKTRTMLRFRHATPSFKETIKEWLEWNDLTENLDIMVFKFVDARGVKVPHELAKKYNVSFFIQHCDYLMCPGTILEFVGCTKIKTKTNKTLRAFKWIASSPKTSDTKTTKVKQASKQASISQDYKLLEVLNYYFEHSWEIDEGLANKALRKCTPKEAKTYTAQKLQSLAKTYQEVEALRLLAKPVFATVFRGTRTMFPFVTPTRTREWTLEEMQKTKYYKLNHLLSTSTSKELAESFTGLNVEKISVKADRVKATYLHVMELEGVVALDIARLLDEILARKDGTTGPFGLMAIEHEILVMPGRDVMFELVKVEKTDKPTMFIKNHKVVKVGDIIPRDSLKISKLVKKKTLTELAELALPKKRKAQQMLNKTKELLKQADTYELSTKQEPLKFLNPKRTIVKDGNVVLYWKVRPIWARPTEPSLLRSLYDKDATFPGWACLKELNLDYRATRVFYDEKDKLVDIKRLALEREPCNIAMSKCFDQAKLQMQFGYSESYYTRYAKAHPIKLPPNIAIYTKTLVNMEQVAKLVTKHASPTSLSTTSIASWFKAKKTKQEKALFKRIHLISLVGLAFDHPSQPDMVFYGEAPSLANLVKAYTRIWQKAFECAKYWNLPTIVATQVGNGAFKPGLYDYKEFKSNVHDVVLSNMKKAYSGVGVVEPRNVFDMIYNMDQAKLDDLLFVNSWDPHSMLGNGNRIDDSLDGKFGRCSAIAVLGWPGTNLHVRYVSL